MKKSTLFLSLILFCFLGITQNNQLSFTASGAANIIDSIYIENLTTGAHLTIMGDDTLTIIEPVGISKVNLMQSKLHIYPNPASDFVTVELFSEKNTNATILLSDVAGRSVFEEDLE